MTMLPIGHVFVRDARIVLEAVQQSGIGQAGAREGAQHLTGGEHAAENAAEAVSGWHLRQ